MVATITRPRQPKARKRPPVTIILTRIQAWALELIREGKSESYIVGQHTGDHCTYHSIKVALRAKGCIGKGRPGHARSIPIYVQPDEYVVKIKSQPARPEPGYKEWCDRLQAKYAAQMQEWTSRETARRNAMVEAHPHGILSKYLVGVDDLRTQLKIESN